MHLRPVPRHRPSVRATRLLSLLTVLGLAMVGVAGPVGAAGPEGPPVVEGTRQVMFVGNNWEGTATIVDAHPHEVLRTIDTIPDRDERMAEITSNPDRLGFCLSIQQLIGEGNDQYTDDMFTTHDGTHVMVSRPSFADVVSIDLATGEVTRVADLPVSDEAEQLPREQYLLDSAHHGLAMNAAGDTLCAAGTMSDYAAMVDRETFEVLATVDGTKPYWSANGPDDTCWVSWSGDDEVSVLAYPGGQELARIPVGDHPQRVRLGIVREDLLAAPADEASDGGSPLPVTGGSLAALGLVALGGGALLVRHWRREA